MAGQKSSIKGRGTEVLVGVPRAVAVKPEDAAPSPAADESPEKESPETEPSADQVPGEALAAPSPAEESPPPTEAELSAALYEEAQAAEPVPTEGEVPWAKGSEWPPTPEMELAMIEHDRQVRQSSQPPSPTYQPTSEGAMEGSSSAEGQTTMSGVLPPKTSPAAYALGETGSTEELDIQSPEEPAERLELPERPLTEEQTEESADQTSARIRQLNDEIDRVYEQVLTEVGENESIATQCYNDLLRARDILLRRDVGQLAQAEYYIEQARARLKRAATSGAGARKNAWWIFAWGLFWGMILVAGLILLDSSYVQDTIALLDLKSPFVDPRVLLPAMLWGALGGVVAIWYSLFKHIAERDFDSHYNISYVGKPLFGLILGATVYMIANLLIVSLGIWPGSSTESATPAIAPWIIYLVSWVCGFKENRVFGLVDEVMKRLFPATKTTTTTSTGLTG